MKKVEIRLTLLTWSVVMLLTAFLPIGEKVAAAQSLIADDFETGLRVINPAWPIPQSYLWHQCDDQFCQGGSGSEAVNGNSVYEGTQSLEITINSPGSSSAYMQWYTLLSGNPNTWRWLREWVLQPANWQFRTYDMMRFWVKVPQGIDSFHRRFPASDYSFVVGTYLRASASSQTLQESPDTTNGAGHHWYHWYNIPYTGQWHQVIVDTSPDLQRDIDPAQERGNQEWVIRDQYGDQWNYFDAMTRIYFDVQDNPSSYPARFYFDKFEFFRNPYKDQEDVASVRSLNGVYVPSTKQTFVGWRSVKTDQVLTHEVRYAFSNIHVLGFSNAIPAPNGMVQSSGVAGYNSMQYSTTAIDVGSNPSLYIAIRPQGATKFRQIVLPTGQGNVTVPAPPQNLRTQ